MATVYDAFNEDMEWHGIFNLLQNIGIYIIGRIMLSGSAEEKHFILLHCDIFARYFTWSYVLTTLTVELNEIRDALKDPELQKMVLQIDGSSEPEKVIYLWYLHVHPCDT